LLPFLPVAAALALAAGSGTVAPSAAEGAAAPPGAVVSVPVMELGAPAPVAAAPASAAPAQPEAAGPVLLAVVPLDAPTELALVGRSLGEAIAQEAGKTAGFQVVGPSAVLAKLGPDGAAAAAQCGESAGCYVAHAARLGVDRIVGGRIDRVGTNYRFALVLVDAKGGTAVARANREVPIASRRIRADVVAATGPLLRGEAAGTGVLALQTELPGAEVRIDDQPAGRTPLEAKLPAGKHKVEVSQRGRVRVEPFWVDVPAGGRAEQRVRLYEIPLAERKPGEIETVTVELGKAGKRKK